ncbi:MAG: cytochrome c3 family protein [Myxococcota bacterium]
MLKILPALAAAGCTVGGGTPGYEPPQPIAFSHAQHAGELQIDCLHCHFGAETSRHAGVPPANVCMNCHTQAKKDSPEIAKLRDAISSGRPIQWVKVHSLPDFAYFNHARHVGAGVACASCHGAVETMVRVRQEPAMTMGWCLDCHRTTAQAATARLDPPRDCAACHY